MPCKPPKVKKNHSGIIIPLFIVVLDKKVFFATIWSNIIMGVKMKNHDWENTNFDDMNSDDTNSYGVNPYKHIEFSEKNAKLNENFTIQDIDLSIITGLQKIQKLSPKIKDATLDAVICCLSTSTIFFINDRPLNLQNQTMEYLDFWTKESNQIMAVKIQKLINNKNIKKEIANLKKKFSFYTMNNFDKTYINMEIKRRPYILHKQFDFAYSLTASDTLDIVKDTYLCEIMNTLQCAKDANKNKSKIHAALYYTGETEIAWDGANKLKEILNTNVNNIEEFIMQYRTKNFIDLVYQTYPELRDKSNDLKEFEKSFYKMFLKLQKQR